ALISSKILVNFLLRPVRAIQANQTDSVIVQHRGYIDKQKTLKEKALKDLDAVENKLRINNIPLEFSEFESELANLESQHLKLLSSLEKIRRDVQVIQDQIDEIVKSVISQARIIGLTLSKLCIDTNVSKLKCENIIIDELSTAPFPLVLVALIAPTKRAVFFGDPKQLPPISLSKTDYSQKYLQHDTYEIIDQHKNVRHELTEQWRMPVSIVEFVNNEIYDGKLRTHPTFEKERNKDILEDKKSPFTNNPFKDHQVIFIDTSSINPWCGYDANQSRYNLYSAHIIAELIAQEVEEKPEWSNAKDDDKKKIGVICPYRAQKQLLKKLSYSRLEMIGKSELLEKYIDFHTVDSFQGEQRDVVILDLTAGQPSGPGIRLS
ncbi:MAG TPA: AAA domain-containing protein, partial [Bacteroidia bacterium]|nr:AAA domain-containing protein [Bacteroidia bacterium]